MDTQNIEKNRYMPHLRGAGWIERDNWSCWLENDKGIFTKHYGLPEDYQKYFTKQGSNTGFRKLWQAPPHKS